MSASHRDLAIVAAERAQTIDITERVADVVRDSGIADGICVVTIRGIAG